MSNNLKCDDRKNGGAVATGVNGAWGNEFKNPYKTSKSAITTTAFSDCKAIGNEGETYVTDDGTTFTVKSCTKKDEDILSGTVTIE